MAVKYLVSVSYADGEHIARVERSGGLVATARSGWSKYHAVAKAMKAVDQERDDLDKVEVAEQFNRQEDFPDKWRREVSAVEVKDE